MYKMSLHRLLNSPLINTCENYHQECLLHYTLMIPHTADVGAMRRYSQEDNSVCFLSEKHILEDLLKLQQTSVVSLGLSHIYLLILGEVKPRNSSHFKIEANG